MAPSERDYVSRPRENRDLGMEAHLRAMALWYRLVGILGILGCVWVILNSFTEGVALLILPFGLVFLLGHSLSKYGSRARTWAGLLTILGLIGYLIQILGGGGLTVVGALVGIGWAVAQLWALFNARSGIICTEEYRALVARTPALSPPTFSSPFFWVPLILLALSGVAVATGAVKLR